VDLAAVSGGAFLSQSWYRVAGLRPALKSQASIRRHRFRGEVWYVVQDPASGRFNRFTPAAWQLLGLMDGRRSMDEIWLLAVQQLGDDTPSQEEVIGLLSQLHAADLMHCEVNPDSAELFERFEKQDRTRRRTNLKNPFSIRIPLWDPDAFLTRTMPRFGALFGWAGVALYLGVTLYALMLVGVNWSELSGNLSDRIFSTQNLLALTLCFPLVKLMHEMGHGYAVKAGGGEVHEMGIMLLVFMPIPYVDASAASGFRSKWRRALVGAAGMLVELFIAALAMLFWVSAEPGFARALAFNVMLIAGVSAVLFNGNPLLRYDAYYILSDLIEMPNLAARGNQYWRYLFERYVFRVPQVESPLLSDGERRWLIFYTPAALVYRTLVLLFIVLYIASEWFFFGVVLAIWGAITMFGMPLSKVLRYLLDVPRVAGARKRALTVSLGALACVTLVLFAVPAPMRVMVEGVVWLPEEAHVRAGADGFVSEILVASGSQVEAGTALVQSEDPALMADLRAVTARLQELEATLDSQRFEDRVAADVTREEIVRERAAQQRLQDRVAKLVARSAVSGRYVIDRTDDLPGRFYRKGDRFGYVIQDGVKIVRIVVSQDDVDLVRNRLQRIDVRLRERLADVYPATLVRAVPAAKDYLPSTVLSSEGGGAIAADPRDPKSGKTLQRMFQFDLELPQQVQSLNYGGRAYVRLILQPEPLASQWSRRLRQLFLERFSV
jgi:putative peptide zinc metalloprotease protein